MQKSEKEGAGETTMNQGHNYENVSPNNIIKQYENVDTTGPYLRPPQMNSGKGQFIIKRNLTARHF